MAEEQARDWITVEDEEGNSRVMAVEALFDMDDEWYALLQTDEEMVLMRVEGEGDDQFLVSVDDPEEKESILDAYQIAMEASPTEGNEQIPT